MRTLIFSIILLSGLSGYARDPGTGSNTTIGPGVPTPDSGSEDTSIMRGGTPGGNESEDKQFQEEKKEQLEKKTPKTNITDQNSNLDTL